MHTDSLPRDLQGMSSSVGCKGGYSENKRTQRRWGEESSPRMANNMAMTPEDKAELARLDAEQVEDDAEVIQIAVERTQYAQQGVGWQERKVQMP